MLASISVPCVYTNGVHVEDDVAAPFLPRPMSDFSERCSAAASHGSSSGSYPADIDAFPLREPPVGDGPFTESSSSTCSETEDRGDRLPTSSSAPQPVRLLVYALPFRSQRSPNDHWGPNPGLAPSEDSAHMLRCFKQKGYDVDWVNQRQQCLDACETHPPNALILMASALTSDVLDMCQRLMPHLGHAGPPLIVLAPFKSAPHLLNSIFATGIAEYLPRTVDPELLVHRVNRWVHLYQATTELRQHQNQDQQWRGQPDGPSETIAPLPPPGTPVPPNSDRITQLPDRSGLEQRLREEWRRLARDYETLSVVTINLEDFAQFITLYGVTAGDQYLQDVADALKIGLRRPADFLARTGTDTFSVILPGTNHQGAMHVAERLIQAVRSLQIPYTPQGTPPKASPSSPLPNASNHDSAHGTADPTQTVNVCAGVTTQIPDLDLSSFTLLAMAEKALVQAKEEGGDRAVFLPGPSPSPPQHHSETSDSP